MKRFTQIITVALGVACLVLAAMLQRKPPPPERVISSPSAKILLTNPPPDVDEALLHRPVSQFDVIDMPLESATKKLGELTSAIIEIDPDILKPVYSTPLNVTVHVQDTTLGDALRAIIRDVASRGFHDIDFDAADGKIGIGSYSRISHYTKTDFFNIRGIINRASADAPWIVPNDRDGDTGAIQIMRLLTATVDNSFWRDLGGRTASAREIGGTLIVTETPASMVSVKLVIDALDRASASDSPVALHLRTNATKWPNIDDLYFFINLSPLLAHSECAGGMPGERLTTARRELRYLVREIAGPLVWEDGNATVGYDCCNLLVLRPPPKNEDRLLRLFDALLRSTKAADLTPMMVDADVEVNPRDVGMRTAFFNVRALRQALVARDGNDLREDAIRKYVMEHVPKVNWWDADGGYMYQIGDVLAITQTPDNIAAVQHALEELRGK